MTHLLEEVRYFRSKFIEGSFLSVSFLKRSPPVHQLVRKVGPGRAPGRRRWASWHVQHGTPLHALQELGGWESSDMVRRYAHFSVEHLAPYADRLSALRVVENSANGTNSAQPENGSGVSDANSK